MCRRGHVHRRWNDPRLEPAPRRPVSPPAWLPGTFNSAWCPAGGRDPPEAGRRPESRPAHLSDRAHGITFVVPKRKISCREHTSTQRTNGGPSRAVLRPVRRVRWRRDSEGRQSFAPGHHTPGTSSPPRFDSADGRSGRGSPTTRNAAADNGARLNELVGGSPAASARNAVAIKLPPHDRDAGQSSVSSAACSSSAQARASRQKSLVVSASERPGQLDERLSTMTRSVIQPADIREVAATGLASWAGHRRASRPQRPPRRRDRDRRGLLDQGMARLRGSLERRSAGASPPIPHEMRYSPAIARRTRSRPGGPEPTW